MVLKKNYVIDDIQEIKNGSSGIYAIMPYEQLQNGKALFKVGMATDLKKRFEQYHTSYPLGFYYKNILANPMKERKDFYYKDTEDRNKRKFSQTKYLNHVENFVHENIVEKQKGKQLYSTTRVRNPKTSTNGITRGQTEWFLASPKQIENSFTDAFKIYGGTDYSTHMNDINKKAEQNKKGASYTAEIHYKIYKRIK